MRTINPVFLPAGEYSIVASGLGTVKNPEWNSVHGGAKPTANDVFDNLLFRFSVNRWSRGTIFQLPPVNSFLNSTNPIFAAGTFAFTPATPHGAKAEVRGADLVNGFLVGVTLLHSGYGYTNPPNIRITGGGGQGATAVCELTGECVTSIRVVSPGSGYTSAPEIIIDSPAFVPWVEVSVSRVKVTQHVRVGRSYVLLSSFDLTEWTQVGQKFTPTTEVVSQEFEVQNTGRFFKIQEVP